MPIAAVIRTSAVDAITGGWLVGDSGLQESTDDFDTWTREVLMFNTATLLSTFPLGGSLPAVGLSGVTIPAQDNMYLVSRSPQTQPGGYVKATLTYKGLADREPFTSGVIPLATDASVKVVRSFVPFEKYWAQGDLALTPATLFGFLATDAAAPSRTQEFRRAWSFLWVATAPLADVSPFAVEFHGLPAPRDWNGTLANAVRNIPWGNVPQNGRSEPVARGVSLYFNQVELIETPKFSAT